MEIKNPFSVNCREATYLLSKHEEHKLGYYQRFRLFTHMIWCKMCQSFVKQNKYIVSHATKINANDALPADYKLMLSSRINDELNKK